MKIPRPRQNPHVARMADFLGWVAGVVAAVVVERLGRHAGGLRAGFSAERIVGEKLEIMGAVEQPVGDQP
jgi:hypothetical protein